MRPPITSARTSLPPASRTNSCTRMLTLAALKASMMEMADAVGLGQDHAHALRAFQQLDDDGCATDLRDHVLGLARPVREGCRREAHAGAGKQLQRAQLVARAADGDALVQRKHALHLELPQNCQPVVRHRGADAGNDGVTYRQCLATMPHDRLVRRDLHVHVQRVDHIDLMAACARRLDDTPVRVEAGIAREHDELHADLPPRLRTGSVSGASAAAKALIGHSENAGKGWMGEAR